VQKKMLGFEEGFRVAAEVRELQAAEMVLAPGDCEGGDDNHHRGADQWLFVVEGRGVAEVDGTSVVLEPGVLLVIEKQERHQIRNTGDGQLKTLNFYYPPAFDRDGEPKGPGKQEGE